MHRIWEQIVLCEVWMLFNEGIQPSVVITLYHVTLATSYLFQYLVKKVKAFVGRFYVLIYLWQYKFQRWTLLTLVSPSRGTMKFAYITQADKDIGLNEGNCLQNTVYGGIILLRKVYIRHNDRSFVFWGGFTRHYRSDKPKTKGLLGLP